MLSCWLCLCVVVLVGCVVILVGVVLVWFGLWFVLVCVVCVCS